MSTDREKSGLLLEVRAQLAQADQLQWDEQIRLMKRAGAEFDGVRTWVLRIGSFDGEGRALRSLGCFAEAANEFGTAVALGLSQPPEAWEGPTLQVGR
jgi:hypothetical protein